MQTNPKVDRSIGLIAILGLLALLVGFIVMLVLPGIRYAAWGILALGVLLLATAFIIDYRRVTSAITGKRGRFSAGTTIMASIFIGIILLVTAISVGNYHRFDLTGVAQFTLTSQTKEVLSELETPVEVLCFFPPGDPIGDYVTNLLTEYQNNTEQLNIAVIDPEEHPDQARRYGITQYPTIVFESENLHRLVLPQDIIIQLEQDFAVEAEYAFTRAILEVTGTVQKKVYFLAGHGEPNIKSTASNGYSKAREGLLDNLYQVETLDLLFTKSIPDDSAALIIAAPQTSLNSSEVEIIEHYLESSGRVLFLVNPNSPQEIKQLLSSWGIEIGDGIVIDPSSYVEPSIDSPSVPRDRNVFGLPTIYFPGATAIIPHPEYTPKLIQTEEGEILPQVIWTSEDSQITMSLLIWASEDSWLEMNFDPREEPKFDEGIDQKGLMPLSFLIFTPPTGEAEEEQGTALIVIGDSDFASNQHFYNGNNSDLFLSSVNWLTVGEELISIDRKVVQFRRLPIGPETANFIRISSMGLLPLLVLVTGGIIWWRRR